MATNYMYTNLTKHLNIKLYHFIDYISRGEININETSTAHQLTYYVKDGKLQDPSISTKESYGVVEVGMLLDLSPDNSCIKIKPRTW